MLLNAGVKKFFRRAGGSHAATTHSPRERGFVPKLIGCGRNRIRRWYIRKKKTKKKKEKRNKNKTKKREANDIFAVAQS